MLKPESGEIGRKQRALRSAFQKCPQKHFLKINSLGNPLSVFKKTPF
jgi:hypothetical protein